MTTPFDPSPSVPDAAREAASPLITWSWTADISDVIVALGVVAALFVGVGNWFRESRREKELKQERLDSAGIYMVCELVNIKIMIERIRARFIRDFDQHSAEHGIRTVAHTRAFVHTPNELRFPALIPVGTGIETAATLPPKVVTRLCAVQYCIAAWNVSVENNLRRSIAAFEPGDQDVIFDMIESLDGSVADASKTLHEETGWGVTEVYADELNNMFSPEA